METRDDTSPVFVKGALHFVQARRLLRNPIEHARVHTQARIVRAPLHPHITVIKLSQGALDDKDNVTVCDLLCQKRK